LYLYRSDFQRYSIGTVGVFKRFERAAITGGDLDTVNMECIECEKDIVTAERRRYWKEIVVFGAAVWRQEVGESFYCEDHVSFELLGELDDADHIYAERLPVSIGNAVLSFATMDHELEVEDNPAFESTEGVASGILHPLNLIPMMIIVLTTVLVLNVINLAAGSIGE
jgi:hypothetical protein